MLEPLGQSQVLSYLKGLSGQYRFSLISFEKKEDLRIGVNVEKTKKDCESHQIRWLPQTFHYRPRIVAPVWSMLIFLFLCLREVRKGNADLIHARSYIPAAVALIVNKLTGTPFVFDMRALWPEELITAGRLRRGSFIHKAIEWVERACLKNASSVVSLTHAAVDYLHEKYPEELRGQNIVVIPTCADLERFVPIVGVHENQPIYSCCGTVLSGWFHLNWLAKFFQVVAENDPSARFEVITRDDANDVRSQLGGGEGFQARLDVFGLPSYKVHGAIQKHTASAMFFTQGVSKLGSSPTRMGEILGCGLPVVANSGVGDVARIIEQYGVGVLVNDGSYESMKVAFKKLTSLRTDPKLSERCRRAAEEIFSLKSGQEKYGQLYNHILLKDDSQSAD